MTKSKSRAKSTKSQEARRGARSPTPRQTTQREADQQLRYAAMKERGGGNSAYARFTQYGSVADFAKNQIQRRRGK